MRRASSASAGTSTRSRSVRSRRVRLQPDVRRGLTFDDVRKIGVTLPGAEATKTYGSPSLTVGGRMFVCIAINKAAEPNSLIVQCDVATRDAMLAEQPDLYYTAAHYENYACVLVRLSRVDRGLLEDLVRMSHRFVVDKYKGKKKRGARKPRRPVR